MTKKEKPKSSPFYLSGNDFGTDKISNASRLLAWLPAVLIAAAIFWFSAQPAEESTEMSDAVSRLILWIGTRLGFFHGDPAQYAGLIELMSFPVRKTAHMTEYLIFYGSIRFGFHVSVPYRKERAASRLFAAFAVVFLYACTDEFHQLFVPGRAGRFTDVMIDCFGVLIVTIICLIRQRRQSVS